MRASGSLAVASALLLLSLVLAIVLIPVLDAELRRRTRLGADTQGERAAETRDRRRIG